MPLTMNGRRAMQVPSTTQEAEQRFEDLIEALGPEVRRKQMMGRPTLMAGSKLFACLNGDGLGIKLGRDTERFAEALRIEGAEVFAPGPGHTFKDWVSIPSANADEWVRFAIAGIELVRGSESSRE